ncbi:MAG: hypothetical protein ACI9YT_000669 [Halobacteriales archaeon]|jgi:hypothetical protein
MTVPPEVESLVEGVPANAHVATSVADRLHVAPVWYGYRDGVLYFVTGGRKLENLRRNPRVAISIEDACRGDVNWNVTLLGSATITREPERLEWASDWIYDRDEDPAVDEIDVTEDDDAPDSAAPDRTEPDDVEPGEDKTDVLEGIEPRAVEGIATDDVEDDYALVEVPIGSATSYVYD